MHLGDIKNMIKMYNKKAVIFHFPGIDISNKYLWNKLIKISNKNKFNFNIKEATIITWSNQENQPLEKCLNNMNICYKKLGTEIKDWNNITKITLTKNYLEKIKTKYVIGLDCCDVLILKNPNIIIEKFKKNNCKMLFNSQCICYPKNDINGKPYDFVDFENRINKNKYKNCYLNAGCWVAETDFCKEFYNKCEYILKNNNLNKKEIYWKISDQAYIRKAFMSFEKEIKLDYKNEIFQVIERI
jgi:hypothetical protein